MGRYKIPNLSRSTAQTEELEPDEKAYNEQTRKLALSKAKFGNWVRSAFLGGLAVITLVFLFVFFWHLLAPVDMRWLPIEEVESLKSLAISIMVGLIMSSVTFYFFTNQDPK